MRRDPTVHLLGSTAVSFPDGRVIRFGQKPTKRRLLAHLALRARHTVHASTLAAALWPDVEAPERRTLSRLRYNVSTLREELHDGDHTLITTHGPGYRLELDPDQIDVERFVRAVENVRRSVSRNPSQALRDGAEALEMWDEPLADFRFDDFAQSHISRLSDVHRQLVLAMAQADLILGDHLRALDRLDELERGAGPDQTRSAIEMVALFRSGRQRSAIDVFDRLRSELAEFGLEPSGALQELEDRILTGDARLYESTQAILDTEPVRLASPGFVGRDEDLATLERLVRTHRMVTISGIGGMGKTRLAQEGARLLRSGGSEVVEVDLRAASGSLDRIVADAARVRAAHSERLRARIAADLERRRAVLLLDNGESALDEVRSLATDLLERTDRLRILTTSRMPIGCPGEVVWGLGALSVPEEEPAALSDVARSPAVQVLLGSAGAELEDRRPDEWERLALLARAVGGVPLLCETTGALVEVVGSDVVLDLVQSRLGELRTRDDTTVREVLQWSFERLDPVTSDVLLTCSVFVAPFDPADISDLGHDPLAVAESLRRLFDMALVSKTDEGGLLIAEPVRQAVWAQAEPGLLARHRVAHAEHILGFARRSGRLLLFDPTVVDVLRGRQPDVRTALSLLAREQRWFDVGRLAAGLDLYYLWAGRSDEGRRWLDAASVRLPRSEDPLTLVRCAEILRSAGFLASIDGDHGVAQDRLRRSIEMFRRVASGLGDADIQRRARLGSAWSHFHLARSLASESFGLAEPVLMAESRRHFDEALRIADEYDMVGFRAWFLPFVAWQRIVEGERAVDMAERAIESAEAVGLQEPLGIAYAVRAIGRLREDPTGARADVVTALECLESTGNLYSLQITHTVRAAIAIATRDDVESAIVAAVELLAVQPSEEFDGLTAGMAAIELARRDAPEARAVTRWLDDRHPHWTTMVARLGVGEVERLRRRALALRSPLPVPASSRELVSVIRSGLADPGRA